MTHQTDNHDRALLAHAATIALPATVSAVLIILYIAEHEATANLVLAGSIILAVTATGVACIQQQRRTRDSIDGLRAEVADLRDEIRTLRVADAVTEIADLSGSPINGKVVRLARK